MQNRWLYEGEGLLQWRADFSANLRLDDHQRMVYRDEPHASWHLFWLENRELLLRRVHLKVWVHPCPSCTTQLYFHQFARIDLAHIDATGQVIKQGECESLTVERRADGCLLIDVVYVSRHPRIFIGTRLGGAFYMGTGHDQYAFERIEIESSEAQLNWASDEERIRLIDVGGAGGVQDKWLPHLERVLPVLFEPDPTEAVKLAPWKERVPGCQVIQQGLLDTVGPQELNITRGWGCSSVRRPNHAFLEPYVMARHFDVLRKEKVECTRYDLLFEQGLVPSPDVIKADVQGCEHEVLTGFGKLLDDCLGVEIEAQFYPIYEGQKLLPDLVALLGEHGLIMRALYQVPNFDGDAVEFDAVFTLNRSRIPGLDPIRKRKLELLLKVWDLPGIPGGA